jgi:uncharacterized protein YdhG (YjbR/CyaY superfamily)
MAKRRFKSVDEYIAAQPEAARDALEQVRSAIRKALPGAEEVISYNIAAYRLHGAIVLYFAGWKRHFSLYPATDGLVAALGDDVAPYVVSKGTMSFALADAPRLKLIQRIAKFRAREVAERAKARAPKRR